MLHNRARHRRAAQTGAKGVLTPAVAFIPALARFAINAESSPPKKFILRANNASVRYPNHLLKRAGRVVHHGFSATLFTRECSPDVFAQNSREIKHNFRSAPKAPHSDAADAQLRARSSIPRSSSSNISRASASASATLPLQLFHPEIPISTETPCLAASDKSTNANFE